MTADQFIWWLRGYLDSSSEPAGLSVTDVATICKALDAAHVARPAPTDAVNSLGFPQLPTYTRRFCHPCATWHGAPGDRACHAPAPAPAL